MSRNTYRTMIYWHGFTTALVEHLNSLKCKRPHIEIKEISSRIQNMKPRKYLPRSAFVAREFPLGFYFDKAIVKGDSLTWDVKIFERVSNGRYQLNEYKFPERIYPVAEMKSALSERFDILKASLREEGRNILFVCRKK